MKEYKNSGDNKHVREAPQKAGIFLTCLVLHYEKDICILTDSELVRKDKIRTIELGLIYNNLPF